jgi:hypothetical protein
MVSDSDLDNFTISTTLQNSFCSYLYDPLLKHFPEGVLQQSTSWQENGPPRRRMERTDDNHDDKRHVCVDNLLVELALTWKRAANK